MKYAIGQLAEIIDGDRGKNYPQQHEFLEEGYCLFLNTGNVTATGFSFESNQYISKEKCDLLRKGKLRRRDIVYTTRRTVGNAAFYADSVPYEHIRINSGMVIIRPDEAVVCTEFLYQILKSDYYRPYFKKYCTGSAQPQLPIKNFSTIELDLPDLGTQKKIADILSAYDDLMANNQKQIKLLEEAAQRLYKEWFADLRFPGHETTPITDCIPEGWEQCRLDEMIAFNPKVALNKNRVKQSVPMAALSTTSMVLNADEFTTTLSNSGSKFQNGDTLLARITPCLENGKIAFVSGIESDEGAVGSTEYIVMRSSGLCPYMVYLLARTEEFRQEAINSMTGSDGRQRAQVDKLKALPYLKPPITVVEQFEKCAAPLFAQISTKNRQNAELRRARDILLPKLMNGEIEV